ncbi:hypothetical protein QJQ45_011515 [Haematococcus lacustris]|nr:hypothetical protein QJQ45_011515 [Haematococcus lacustris]
MGDSIADTPEWSALTAHMAEIKQTHLRDMMADERRCMALIKESEGIYFDFSRQRVNATTMEVRLTPNSLPLFGPQRRFHRPALHTPSCAHLVPQLLLKLAEAANLRKKIDDMFNGEHLNSTEDRAVLHVATRARRDQKIVADGKNVVPDVWDVLDKIKRFSDKVRSGEWLGATGKPLKHIVAVGIGGSFLGPLFVHTALKTEPMAAKEAEGRSLHFLANVDPIDVARALNGLNPEETLVVVVSKTFTTAETMLNARTVRKWLVTQLGPEAVAKHMVAVSTNLKLVKEFGIDPDNAFGFWDWVGGRYSVCSAVGMLPLSLQYGFDIMETFLAGANNIDDHFRNMPLDQNLPVLMGLLSVWNVSFLGYPARAILPYCQALSKLAPHIQQVSMESNGKGVDIHGAPLPFDAGEIDFGEPGTNGQHSFYQLIHQGRVVPCDFIGIVRSQQSVYLKGEIVSNHDELMCNFFAQADALAYGKTPEQLRSENVPDYLIPHRTFTGNRPSMSIMLPNCTAYTVGQILALYEHRVAVQGFIWGINSFDQWGVELGKVLASKVRTSMHTSRTRNRMVFSTDGFNYSTTRMINKYLEGKTQMMHLRDMMADERRCMALIKESEGIYFDFSRQRVNATTMEVRLTPNSLPLFGPQRRFHRPALHTPSCAHLVPQLLLKLAEAANLRKKIDDMFNGEHLNSTEDRAVLHVATRARRDQKIVADGKNVVPDVWDVLDKIKRFSDKVRSGEWLGATGKPLKHIVAVGIGGSFLGPLFVHTALKTEPMAAKEAEGRSLRFLANVDPIDVARALNGLNAEETLVVVVSKTFTTAETMLNARTVRKWLVTQLGPEAVAKHMVAVSTNLKLVKEFGIDPDNAFGFWDWVGGRYSVCSAVGMLPLSLQYGFDIMETFLAGANNIDDHFRNMPLDQNLPVLMGLLSVWNVSFLGYPARAILPYCQALSKLAPHIQQVSMESNGKGVDIHGAPLPFDAGEIDFGEPGTNGQHSFYQLIHQGRVVPCDFIGIVRSQQSVYLKGEIVSNHDELMCNFFAQADALAYGKTPEQLRSENVPDYLIPHRTFTGNRPSMSIMLPNCTAYTVGQILALYEHRVAVQGFIWGINSFDQWGVELGKVLASKVRTSMHTSRTRNRMVFSTDGFNYSTTRMINKYLEGKTQMMYAEGYDTFPVNLLPGATI